MRLRRSGLKDFAQHYPAQLSGGMRQRAALARALSLETPILLMDEPFGALDEQTRMMLGEDLSVLLAHSGKTIVFVTHSLGEAVFLADRVAVFSARPGTIKEIIAVDEPHPRKPEFVTSAKFTELRNHLYALLHDEIRKAVLQSGLDRDAAETAPCEAGPAADDAHTAAARRNRDAVVSRLVQVGFLAALMVLWYLAANRWGVNRLLLPNPSRSSTILSISC